ncbi:hypothetical protein KR222_008647, partial [Zaprionus bogoriensis]
MQPKPKKYIDCLRQHFGVSKFKPLQWRIVRAMTDTGTRGRDVCAVVATGYGKSLSYQFPAFYLNKVVVVISPLIALMEDQVNALNARSEAGECACLLGTAQEDRSIKERILQLQFRLVYATPEYITRGKGLKLLRDLGRNLALIAIDEAHCISKWGHEFRPAYRQLQQLREAVPHVRLLALTGTATRRVREDICEQLQLRRTLMVCSSMDRPNLELTARAKSTDLWSDLQPYLSWADEAGGSVIVYNNTIRETEHLAKVLSRRGRSCHSYHSKLPLEQRRQRQQQFRDHEVRLMAATSAFGMGIDQPNVRLVLHYGAPSDMERYYQEIGRAGRDGLAAKCVLFYGDSDATTHQRLQHSQALSAQRSEELQRLARSMQEYTQTTLCRRRFILEYFDDADALSAWRWRRNCCDNCRKSRLKQQRQQEEPQPAQLDVSSEARLLLGMLRDVEGRVGLGKIILALRGSHNKSVSSECQRHGHYGAGAHRSIAWYKALAEHLKATDYIKEDYQKSRKVGSTFGFPMPQVTLKGCCWLDDEAPSKPIVVQASSSAKWAKLMRPAKVPAKREKTTGKTELDWGSDIEIDLEQLDELVEREQEQQAEQQQKQQQQQSLASSESVWGPDPDIDFNALDAAIAKSSTESRQSSTRDLELLLADCQKILHEEQEEAERTQKARKRVWQYLEGSYQKLPMIPKYKYSRS